MAASAAPLPNGQGGWQGMSDGIAGSLPLLLASGIAVLVAWRAKRQARHLQSVRGDLAALHRHLQALSTGNFQSRLPKAATGETRDLHDAVDVLAKHVRETVDGLQEVAQSDPLTGLPNRAHFQQSVERQLAQLLEAGRSGCLLFMDIDGFKAVNDTLGHDVGDRILQIASDRLKLATRLSDRAWRDGDSAAPPGSSAASICRLGGDEFTVFLPDVEPDTIARKIALRIQRVMAEPFELGSRATGIGASIGVATAPRDGTAYGELLRAADTAMYHAKRLGRNRVEFYSGALDEEARRLAAFEQELREALAAGQFELHYQPLYDCRSLHITSAEALIRWRHPRKGLLLPAEFIPLAERLGLIGQIGEWVVAEAIRQIATFERDGMPLAISVNVSPSQLQQMEFISLVKATLAQSHARPDLLQLEITEHVAMQDVDLAADRLQRIRKLGVSVAIDDFGTGYSNLASLIRLPFSVLKLDRSLIVELSLRADARTLVQTIVGMANTLGFTSVAEGVESREQLELLTAMGCNVVQGFLMSRPIGADDLRALLHAQHPDGMLNQQLTTTG